MSDVESRSVVFLDDPHESGREIRLVPGVAWCLYTDEGPGGICGQAMSITCPHSVLYLWPDELTMRKAMEDGKVGRGGRRSKMQWGVIADYVVGGKFSIVLNK